jgi:hypothetical protein
MADIHTTEERLSELIWRTLKLRISILIATIVALLIIWSAVLSGDQRAKDVDTSFCSQLVTDTNAQAQVIFRKLHPKGEAILLDPDTTCRDTSARAYIESVRNANELNTLAFDGGTKNAAMILYDENKKKFADYDRTRRDTYRLEIELSTIGKSTITVNALSIAEVAPFATLAALSLVLVLGFQQGFYKSELAALIRKGGEGPALSTARAQFFFVPRAVSSRRFLLPPERFAVWLLTSAAVLSLAGVLSAFVVNVIHLTDSVYGNYLSQLFGIGFLLAILISNTRKAYASVSSAVIANTNTRRKKWLRLIEGIAVATACAALFLPWTLQFGTVPALRGYRFVVEQQPLSQLGAVNTYPIQPRLFAQIRPQVIIALLFIAICALHLIARRRNQGRAPILTVARRFIAALVLWLSLNFILYMAVLEYEAVTGTTWDFINEISLPNLTGGAIGFPLSFYDPSYGFAIFLLCCFVLIWLTFRLYSDSA